jgi:biopolymer transport protein ExbD
MSLYRRHGIPRQAGSGAVLLWISDELLHGNGQIWIYFCGGTKRFQGHGRNLHQIELEKLENNVMPIKTDSLDEPQLNLTPMIDVVFLLIIFFMVGARFTEEANDQKFEIELPTAAPVQIMSRTPDALVVVVARNGTITMRKKELSPEQLLQELRTAKAAYADQAVLIRGDGDGNYQAVIDVMNACHQAGIKKFSLAFKPTEVVSGQP